MSTHIFQENYSFSERCQGYLSDVLHNNIYVIYVYFIFTNRKFSFRICIVKKLKNSNIFKQFKPFDYLFIVIAIISSFIPLGVTFYHTNVVNNQSHLVAVVKIHGNIVDEFPLIENDEHQEITYYPADGQYNIIEIDGDRIRVKEDNSPDQIAVKTSWISKSGQLSVCLPHQLIIEIKSTEPHNDNSEEELILPI